MFGQGISGSFSYQQKKHRGIFIKCVPLYQYTAFLTFDSYIPVSGVIMVGDIVDSPMVKKMGDIRALYANSRCHFNGKT